MKPVLFVKSSVPDVVTQKLGYVPVSQFSVHYIKIGYDVPSIIRSKTVIYLPIKNPIIESDHTGYPTYFVYLVSRRLWTFQNGFYQFILFNALNNEIVICVDGRYHCVNICDILNTHNKWW